MGQPGVPVGLIMACFSVNAFASVNEQKGYPKVPGSNKVFFQKKTLSKRSDIQDINNQVILLQQFQVPLPTFIIYISNIFPMKAISAVIATIMLLMITVALVGVFYVFSSGLATTTTASGGQQASQLTSQLSACMRMRSIIGNQVTLENCGKGVIENRSLVVTMDDVALGASANTIMEGSSGAVNISGLWQVPFGKHSLKISNGAAFALALVDVQTNIDGLAGSWSFDEGGDNKAYDGSGNGNVGTLTNMNNTGNATSGWTAGKYGSALQFDGVNDYVNAGNGASLNIANAITVEIWTKPSATSGWNGDSFYDHGGADWTPANGESINGTHYNIGTFTIASGTTVYVKGYNGAQYGGVEIYANNATILGNLDASGRGYTGGTAYSENGYGPGGGAGGGYGGAGGGYGGAGGEGEWTTNVGLPYGSTTLPNYLGSGGGALWNNDGGNGGGLIKLALSNTLLNNGSITTNGVGGAYGGGGGSGGTIYLSAGILAGNGSISSNGADGNNGGGGGGGGRIAYYYSTKTFSGTITINGGVGYQAGSSGTIYESSNISALISKGTAYFISSATLLTGAINGNSTTTLISAGWNHIALTYNGNSLNLYVNGTLASNQSLTGNINSNNNNLIIGKNFNGTIDEVRIWNKIFAPDETVTMKQII